jgi:hypothetical protein
MYGTVRVQKRYNGSTVSVCCRTVDYPNVGLAEIM